MRCRSTLVLVSFVVGLSLGARAAAQSDRTRCDGDIDGDGRVTVDEILVSVDNALTGCPQPTAAEATPTPTATPSPTLAASCQGASLALDPGVSATCITVSVEGVGPDERVDGCARVRIEGDCPVGRACAAATAHCSCVGGPLAGEPAACNFSTIPGGIRCGGICTGDCVISLEAQ